MDQSNIHRARLTKSIDSCLENSQRLIDESYNLEFLKPTSTRFYILLIAQEEAAKAFILYLIREGVVPMSREVNRAMNDHICKQLVGVLMDYMVLRWESMEELEAKIRMDLDLGDLLPQDVGSALEIFAYEKIARWKSNNWVSVEDPNYDPAILKLSKGARDKRKQDALYVNIGKDGRVASTPSGITDEETTAELERAGEYVHLARAVSKAEAGFDSSRLEKIIKAFQVIFGTMTRTG